MNRKGMLAVDAICSSKFKQKLPTKRITQYRLFCLYTLLYAWLTIWYKFN